MDIEHRHTPQDGCTILFKRKGGQVPYLVDIHECVEHKMEVCHCGIEWGFHILVHDIIRERNDLAEKEALKKLNEKNKDLSV